MIEQKGESVQNFLDLFTGMTEKDKEPDEFSQYSDSEESEEVKQK